ncbi:MFS transporter [Bacillus sp. T33-2]|uniref:MFS transporter n=1 Tax=Bacillus sp. T33-2 TaxID=2054168 RepID=UPI0015E1425E|nr:MFS transporter [Bacillus sp. T33-2]
MNKGIFALALATFVAGTVEFIIAGLLDRIAADLNITVAAVGQLVSAFSLIFAFGAIFLSALTSKFEDNSCFNMLYRDRCFPGDCR